MKKGVGVSGFRRVCVLCAHTDDEFGCAGLIVQLVEAGAEIRYVALSRCEESVPAGFPADVLEKECRLCTARLGLQPANVHIGRYLVRHLPAFRQEILESFVRLQREFEPDLVLLPSSFDTHQDHATVHLEGFRAFKQCSILGYEMPQNAISFKNSAFVPLTEAQLGSKIEALSSYESQAFRPSSSEKFIQSLAFVRGVQCGAAFAEAYEVIRLIV